MRYRPEIDGLRAVAVLPVVLSHAGVPGLPAGFLGVDVFFVISGFLITSILLEEFEQGRFSVVGFYERRMRRILPALACMLLLALPVAWVVMLPTQLKDFGQSIVATVGFAANMYFWLTQDYWAQAAEITPLIHLWSLGIEEQFYVLFPLLLALLHRRPRLLIVTLVLLAVASLAGMLVARSAGHGASAFYLLPFRSWELLAGAASAVWARRRTDSRGSGAWVSGASLVVIAISYVLLGPASNPLLLHLPVVAATSLFLVLCGSGSLVGRLLSLPALVWIGKSSYSMYLFHQPVLAFARLRFGLELSPVAIAACLVVIGLLSALSYRLVEVPFRARGTVSARALVASMLMVGLALVAFGIAARQTNGFWEAKIAQMSPAGRDALAALQAATDERAALWKQLLARSDRDFDAGELRRVLFVGDSLSEDLFVAASLAACGDPGMQFRRIPLDNECIESQSSGRTGVDGVPCSEEMRRFLESTVLRDSDCIVIAATWLETASSLGKLLDLPELRDKGVLVYETHGFADVRSLIAYMDRESIEPSSDQLHHYTYVTRHQRTVTSNAVLEQIATERGLGRYRGYDCFCDSAAESCSVFDDAGDLLIIDQLHLSIAGARFMGPSLCESIRRASPHKESAVP
ncbi:MAG: acyltransferase [Phycisphaerales bacterium]|nr:acyltransferase [Phycisphaerales bacterium]